MVAHFIIYLQVSVYLQLCNVTDYGHKERKVSVIGLYVWVCSHERNVARYTSKNCWSSACTNVLHYSDTSVMSIQIRQLDGLFNNAFKLPLKKTPDPRITDPMWGQAIGDQLVALASNAESHSMSWRHHGSKGIVTMGLLLDR